MPRLNGEAALDLLKALRSDVPVVLSSGFDESEAERRFAGKNLAGFLQKPYQADRLLQAVDVALEHAGS